MPCKSDVNWTAAGWVIVLGTTIGSALGSVMGHVGTWVMIGFVIAVLLAIVSLKRSTDSAGENQLKR